VFTAEERGAVRERVLALARAEPRIMGAALTGSVVAGAEDRWSDVDIFLGVAEGFEVEDVLDGITSRIAEELDPVHHWDLRASPAVYRVFLLPSCLQVDVAVTPAADFGARSPRFRAVFGEPITREPNPLPTFDELAGRGWLDVSHANAAIERGQPWRAEYHVSSLRDMTLALACLRLGETPYYAKGVDRLPADVTAPLADTLVSSVGAPELRRALRAATAVFLHEVHAAEPAVADRLEGPVLELAGG
jgi:predicted nucleotidyltransferase